MSISSSVVNAKLLKVKGLEKGDHDDLLVVEEPLEIQIIYLKDSEWVRKSISVTMRTPGNDFELALGFLFTESIITNFDQVKNIAYCTNVKPEEEGNVVKVEMKEGVEIDIKKLERYFYTSSSCGVCGKSTIDAVMTNACQPVIPNKPVVDPKLIIELSDRLKKAQTVFKYTGGLHASGLFSSDGELMLMREDIGRHNALDKLIGASLHQGLVPLEDTILLVSGRVGFELVQKSIRAGIPMLVAVGAPSSLAVQLAKEAGMTLIGFLRGDHYNVYCGRERLK
ncbi:formate dehydrogenase accessory sulfurtransferase FdhD [Fulvivirgaceae bacterium BMA10]|uniref:Sulfur carrier protein FdhD n=1 Tax=Splendidivirga corallicola TaxID=3051826 RepID=A0ABT8KVD6_9BACT|nr:formate dehydrogenase accessory sulfurtransferase FdhD [Fulvivirgaceae bacterium BMA10]